MRRIALLACFIAFPAFSYPVTYVFTGTVTFIAPDAPMYNSNTSAVGSFTYDTEIVSPDPPHNGLFWGQMTNYQMAVAGQSLYMGRYSLFGGLQSITYQDGTFGFFDEIPGASFLLAPPDVGHFDLFFSDHPFADQQPTPDLPIEDFIGGKFGFSGGHGVIDGVSFGSSIAGTIDSLFRVTPKQVPEPGSMTLFSLGLGGLLVSLRRAKQQSKKS